MTAAPSILESFHHVPDAGWAPVAHTILRAGKVSAGPDYRIIRDFHVGQDILYCLTGQGVVETLDQQYIIRPGQLAWIGNERPHAHHADPSDPWTLLWFRLDGPDLVALRSNLFGDAPPLVRIPEDLALQAWFERLFAAMRSGGAGLNFRLNQMAGEILAMADEARRNEEGGGLPGALAQALAVIRADLGRSWDSEALSALLKVSGSHVRRLFRQHLRTSPHQWLLRERLIYAQALIADSALPIAEIAMICGFCDVYHFSREFKRSVGTPPAAWRRREQGKRL